MEKNLKQRLMLIGAVLVIGILLIYPPSKKLLFGIDISGGVSMIFEIENDPNDKPDPKLAENLIALLKKRVDPKGIYNLTWRPVGSNRIEVQMPLPPAENAALKKAYSDAAEKLHATLVTRGTLLATLQEPADKRAAVLETLSRGSAKRLELLKNAAAKADIVTAIKAGQLPATSSPSTSSAPTTAPDDSKTALRDAEEAVDDAIDAVLEANFDETAFREALESDKKSKSRDKSLEDFKTKYPELAAQIQDVVVKFDAWHEKRVYLEGPTDLRRLLRGSGVLEFRILAEPSPENVTKYDRLRRQLQERGPRPQKGDSEMWFRIDNPTAFFGLNSQAELANFDPKTQANYVVADRKGNDFFVLSRMGADAGLLARQEGGLPWKLLHAGVSRDESGRLCVAFELDKLGGDQFFTLTTNNVKKQLCILVDGVAYSSANINSPIRTRGQIVGDFSQEKIEYLIQTMQAGVLPAKLKDTPVSERVIGSSLGAANLEKTVRAGIIGALLILAIMCGYYLMAGGIAYAAMSFNVMLVLAVMAMLNARITLDGIAGVILSIGMAVDNNVLIYERMREEKARGSSLRLIIKNGYDKVLSVIIDSHVTTLLTCIILYYVGSEEVKGFGLTLGWGVVLNLFTSVFVTRTIFMLLIKYNLIKDVKMFQLIGVPKIDWYAKRRFFIPASIAVTLGGLVLMGIRSPKDYLDVEFLGGVNAEIELKKAGLNDVTIASAIKNVGHVIKSDAVKISNVTVEPIADQVGTFRVAAGDVPAARLAALLSEPLEEKGILEKNGVLTNQGPTSISVRLKTDMSAEQLKKQIQQLEPSVALDATNLDRVSVSPVVSNDESLKGLIWDVTTVVTNKRLVQNALVSAIGDQLRTEPAISGGEAAVVYPITNRRLEVVIPNLPPGATGDLTEFVEGALVYIPHIDPPQPLAELEQRIKDMRLQPDYANLPFRVPHVFGISSKGKDSEGHEVYDSIAIAISDTVHAYRDDAELWKTELADPELNLIRGALANEQSLRRVTQFKPQIAAQATTRAVLALILSWMMIIGYLWVRFGRMRYGTAGVIALVHDVLVALAFVGFSGIIPSVIAGPLLIEDFKINMTVVAAMLTIIGYSINDTIVVFDRIRELRGRLGFVTPAMVNLAINETLSRTIMTVSTVFVVLLAMYIWGGSTIRAFNYCMLVGVLTGCYSSIAIASPLLLVGAKKIAVK